GSTGTIEPPAPPLPPGTIVNGSPATVGSVLSTSPSPSGSVSRDLALHSVHAHHAVQGEAFNGKLAVVLNLDSAALQYSVNWGEDATSSLINLSSNAKHP